MRNPKPGRGECSWPHPTPACRSLTWYAGTGMSQSWAYRLQELADPAGQSRTIGGHWHAMVSTGEHRDT